MTNFNRLVSLHTKAICGGFEWAIIATYEDGRNTVFGQVRTEKGAAARITMYAKRFNLKKTSKFTAEA